jgi:uncharacterized membrane protein YcaP (DUF421 family)
MNLPLPFFLLAAGIRTAIIQLALLLGLRLFGKREMGDLNVYDVVLVLLLGNVVQNAITRGSGNLGVGLVSVATLMVVNRLIGRLFAQKPELEDRFYGEPSVVMMDGKMDQKVMKSEGVTEEEVKEAIRNAGVGNVEDVRLAVLEEDGTISIIAKEKQEK